MSKSPSTFAVSQRVNHSLYGSGTITEILDAYTVIDFDKNGRRKFVTSMVQLEPTTIMAPVKPEKKSKSSGSRAKK